MTMSSFPDHFSAGAAAYARHRFAYPDTFYDHLAALAPGRQRVWDAGAGSGQATIPLAARFAAVVASEPSAAQRAMAPPHPRVEWRAEKAEQAVFVEGTLDAVLVAQAIHWFDRPRFYAVARAALRPGGLIVASTYAFPEVEPAMDAIILDFAAQLAPHWPPESALPHGRYRDLDWPFEVVDWPPTAVVLDWTLADLLGNLGTWSGVQRAVAAEGPGRLRALAAALSPHWGPGSRRVVWPLWVRAGRV